MDKAPGLVLYLNWFSVTEGLNLISLSYFFLCEVPAQLQLPTLLKTVCQWHRCIQHFILETPPSHGTLEESLCASCKTDQEVWKAAVVRNAREEIICHQKGERGC